MGRFHTAFEFGQVELVGKTDKSILVEGDDLPPDFWVPMTQIHEDSEITEDVPIGTKGQLVTTEWWADQKGFL